MERLLDEISFEGPDLRREDVTIDEAYVRRCSPTSSRTKTCRGTFSVERPSTRDSRASRANRSLRTSLCGGFVAALVARGRVREEGPPARAVCARAGARHHRHAAARRQRRLRVVRRAGDQCDGRSRRTSAKSKSTRSRRIARPATEKQRELATLVATLPVRPILPICQSRRTDGAAAHSGAARCRSRAAVAISETLTAEARVPVEMPLEKPGGRGRNAADGAELSPSAARCAAATQLPRRHYFVVAKSPRGRESMPSAPVSVPLETGSSAPGQPVDHAHRDRHDDHLAAVAGCAHRDDLLPPTVKPVPGANATPGQRHAAEPPPLAPLAAKSLGFNTQATTGLQRLRLTTTLNLRRLRRAGGRSVSR